MIKSLLSFSCRILILFSVFVVSPHAQLKMTSVCEKDFQSTSDNNQITFVETIAGPEVDYADSIIQTSDGHYLLGTWTNGLVKGKSEFLLIKTSPLGKPQWAYRYSGSKGKVLFTVRETPDKGYAILGRRIPSVLLIKTDQSGKTQWAKKIKSKSPSERWGPSFVVTKDGGYGIAATTAGFLGLGNNQDILLTKIDANGKREWSKVYGGEQGDLVTSVLETKDGGFLIGGMTDGHNPGFPDFLVLKTDNSGEIQWTRIFGGRNTELLEGMVETKDGDYVIVGSSNSTAAGQDDIAVVKLSKDGTIGYSYLYGTTHTDMGMSIAPNSSGGVVVVGGSGYRGSMKGLIFQLDSNGEISWATKIVEPGNATGLSVVSAEDGGYAFSGIISKMNSLDMIFAKLDSEGVAEGCTTDVTLSRSEVTYDKRSTDIQSKTKKVSVKKLKTEEIAVEIF